jgi:hypothetical protein
VPSALVYQARGDEVHTVIVDGRVLVRDRVLTMLEDGEQAAILQQAQRASEGVAQRAGLGERQRAGGRGSQGEGERQRAGGRGSLRGGA